MNTFLKIIGLAVVLWLVALFATVFLVVLVAEWRKDRRHRG